nr:immunoglobulin heavy chain junction region [Mus musculus]
LCERWLLRRLCYGLL